SCCGRFASKPTYPAMWGRGRSQRAPGCKPRTPLHSHGAAGTQGKCSCQRMDRTDCSSNRPTQEAVYLAMRHTVHRPPRCNAGIRAARNAVETRDDVGLVLRSVCKQTTYPGDQTKRLLV